MSPELNVPAECSRVQSPSVPPNPLLKEFLKDASNPAVKAKTSIMESGDGKITKMKLELTLTDGNEKSGTFDVYESVGKVNLNLMTISQTKPYQIDTVSNSGQWQIQNKPSAFYEGLTKIAPWMGDPNRDLKISLSEPSADSRTTTIVHAKDTRDGMVVYTSHLDEQERLLEQTGTAGDLNWHILQKFQYTFNPDGKITACYRSSHSEKANPDVQDFSLKIE